MLMPMRTEVKGHTSPLPDLLTLKGHGDDGRAANATLVLIIFGFLLRLVAGSYVGLGFGESYHVSCALRPSLSYFDHPPLSLWMGSLGILLADDVTTLAVRLPFIIMFAGTTWLMFVLGRRLYGPWAGFLAALLLNLSAVFTLSVGIFLQPDGPLMFFWLATSYCLCRLFTDSPWDEDSAARHPMRWWVLVGIALGGTMLSKYHGVFLVAGAGFAAIFSKAQRRWLTHPGPYLAIIIAAVMFVPVLLWNSQHDWVSLLWQGNRGLQGTGLRLDWLVRNIGGQALWLLPWLWFPLLMELPRCFRPDDDSAAIAGINSESEARWLLGWLAAPPILLFSAIAAYAPIGFHFHWQAPGYLLMMLPLGATVHRRLQRGHRPTFIWLRGTCAFTLIALIFITSHAATGWWRSVGPQWLSAKAGEPDDPLLEMLDYTPLLEVMTEKGLLERENLFFFTPRWFQSGKVDFALNGQVPVTCFSHDPRGWQTWSRPEDWLGKDAILVSTRKFMDNPVAFYSPHFESVEPIGTVPLKRGPHVEETLYLHYCRRMNQPFIWR